MQMQQMTEKMLEIIAQDKRLSSLSQIPVNPIATLPIWSVQRNPSPISNIIVTNEIKIILILFTLSCFPSCAALYRSVLPTITLVHTKMFQMILPLITRGKKDEGNNNYLFLLLLVIPSISFVRVLPLVFI
jgi:hypothetical protein